MFLARAVCAAGPCKRAVPWGPSCCWGPGVLLAAPGPGWALRGRLVPARPSGGRGRAPVPTPRCCRSAPRDGAAPGRDARLPPPAVAGEPEAARALRGRGRAAARPMGAGRCCYARPYSARRPRAPLRAPAAGTGAAGMVRGGDKGTRGAGGCGGGRARGGPRRAAASRAPAACRELPAGSASARCPAPVRPVTSG